MTLSAGGRDWVITAHCHDPVVLPRQTPLTELTDAIVREGERPKPQLTGYALEDQLVEFTAVLEALCAAYQAATGIDPIQQPKDPTGGRIAVALVGVDIAIERLRAESATAGERPADAARRALAEPRAEDDASAMKRHLALRLAARQ